MIGDTFYYHMYNENDFDYFDVMYPFLMDIGSQFYFNNRLYKVTAWELITDEEREDDENLEDVYIKVISQHIKDYDEVQLMRKIKLKKLLD